jgi:hypothetical protein
MVTPMPGSLQFSSATYSVGEAGPTATITVTRTGGSDGSVGVSYASSNGTATGGAACGTAGVDYQNTSGTLTWANGDSASKTFTVPICDDMLFEGNETVNLALSNATGGATLGTPSAAVLTINDNDTQPSVQFSAATYNSSDDLAGFDGNTVITVTRTGAAGNVVSVNYATSNGTATGGAACGTAGVDYVSTNGTLNFAAGELTKTFNVNVCTDNVFEGTETVNLTLSNPTGAVLGTPNPAVLNILDNDPQPMIQFGTATYTTRENFGQAAIVVTRLGALGNTVSVNVATSNGTAIGGSTCTAGVDFISRAGTLTFAPGETGKTFNVTVCNDRLWEGLEIFNLTLTNPAGGATLGTPTTATTTILNVGSTRVDFDNDGRTEVSVFRAQDADNTYWIYKESSSGGTIRSFEWGQPGDIPTPADFDGDGFTDFAIWRPGPATQARFFIFNSATGTIRIEAFGQTGDNPRIVGDYDGDSRADLAVYRPGANGIFFYRGTVNNPNGNTTFIPWGTTGDKPAAGDYNGDGKMDFVVYRGNGQWWIRYNTLNTVEVRNLGISTDQLVQADYDGDGKTDIAVFRSSDRFWYILLSSNNTIVYQPFGLATDVPVPGDYDGDGKHDIAVYRNGAWFILQSSNQATVLDQLGDGTYTAIPSFFVTP